jgi:hypothetical protein
MIKRRISTKRLKYFLKAAVRQGPLWLKDAVENRRHATATPRILITRPTARREETFDDFLPWVTAEVPELRSRMEFHRLPCRVRDWSPFALHVSWVGDSFDLWSASTARQAERLVEECRRRGIALVNPANRMPNTGKSRGAELMRTAGVRTPRSVRITEPAAFRRDCEGLAMPFLIREERCHGQRTEMVANEADLARIDFARYRWPIAAEFIDTRDPRDGLFRKYRYVAAGNLGLPRHMMVNEGWQVRPEGRVMNDALREEELAYLNRPDPNHEAMQRARRALGLDVLGIDYSYDHDGRVVVWEANAFLDLRYPDLIKSQHIRPAVVRTFAAVSRLYLERAGLRIPAKIDDLLAGCASYSRDESMHSEVSRAA